MTFPAIALNSIQNVHNTSQKSGRYRRLVYYFNFRSYPFSFNRILSLYSFAVTFHPNFHLLNLLKVLYLFILSLSSTTSLNYSFFVDSSLAHLAEFWNRPKTFSFSIHCVGNTRWIGNLDHVTEKTFVRYVPNLIKIWNIWAIYNNKKRARRW